MKTKFTLIIILIIHAILLSKLIFFPYPEFFIYPYLTNNGLKPYSQILDQHFPGLMFLPVNFDNLGMTTPEVARVFLIAVVLATHLLIFVVSRHFFKDNKKALLVNLLYLIWQPYFEGWTFWIDNLLPLFLLPAFYFTLKLEENKKAKNLFFIGLFLGIGVVFKQVLIPFSGLLFLYFFIKRPKISSFIHFGLGFIPPILLMFIYLFKIGVLSDFWYWTIVFNLTTFAEDGKKLPELSHLVRVGFMLAASLSILFYKNRRLILLLALFALAPIVEIYARFDFVHLQPALPFILIATVVGFLSIKDKLRSRDFLIILIGYLLITIWWLRIFYQGHFSDKVFFFGDDIKAVASKIKENTSPGEKIFIFGTVPHLYQITKTLPAGDIFIFQFPWFIKIAQDKVLEGIKKDNPNIIVSDRTVVIEGQKIVDFAPKIDKYIQEHYEEIDSVGSNKILRRKTN